MSDSVSEYEKLGSFYLGKEYDIDKREVTDDLLLYDSKDLVTHGVVLGMIGSGKTGLCIGLLEEEIMDNIPAIVIDPKGDISNLLLTFPEFRGEDFRPWINEDDARKKGMESDAFAEKTAKMWGEGIGSWHQSPDRVRQLKNKTDINVFTPESKSGIPARSRWWQTISLIWKMNLRKSSGSWKISLMPSPLNWNPRQLSRIKKILMFVRCLCCGCPTMKINTLSGSL